MAYETKVGLLVGIGFIVCFAVVLSHRGSGDQISAKMAYDVLSRHGRGIQSRATTIPNSFVRASASGLRPFPTVVSSPPTQRGHYPPNNGGRVTPDDSAKPAETRRDFDALRSRIAGRQTPPSEPAAPSGEAGTMNWEQTGSNPTTRLSSSPTETMSGLHEGDRPISEPVTWESLFGSAEKSTEVAEGKESPATSTSTQPVRPEYAGRPKVRSARYVVGPNDTLWRVAAKAYGKSSRKIVQAIFEANRDRMESMDQLRLGCELVLPLIDGVPGPRIGEERPQNRTREAEPPVDPQKRYYDIQQGDRYATIAEKFLGDRARWREIHQLNKDIFPDPGRIQYGVRIRLPQNARTSSQ